MTYTTKRLARMVKWCNDNPAHLYADYRDELPRDMANMILQGDFDGFSESLCELEWQASEYAEFWTDWEDSFAREFGYDSWADIPDRIAELTLDYRWIDSADWLKTLCRNTRLRVNAVLHKTNGELVYGPSLQHWNRDEQRRARYIRDAFGFAATPSATAQSLEIIYGGYDRESAIVIGTVDLWDILESRTKPTHITVGPRDSDNLLWYEFCNGCGNMGSLPITRTRKWPATFHVDGSRGYGVDDCYGFVGSMWAHELDVG